MILVQILYSVHGSIIKPLFKNAQKCYIAYTVMLQNKRSFLFSLLLLFFFAAAPLLAAFALGYTIDFTHARIEKTGGIFLKSTRRGNIIISLDGIFAKETSFLSRGALLPELAPGMHLVRIEKEGYHPWFKSVSVKETHVTELRNILLVPSPLPYATSTDSMLPKNTDAASSTSTATHRIDEAGNLVSLEEKTPHDIASNVNAFGAIGMGLLMIDKNGFLSIVKGEKIEVLARPGFYLSRDIPVRFIESPGGEVAIIDGSGGLFLLSQNDHVLHTIDGGVKNASFDAEGGKLLIQKEQAIEILWRENNTNQPFQKIGNREEILTIQTLNDPILDAHWYYADNAHIVIHTRDGLYFTEIDERGGRNTVELIHEPVDELFTTAKNPELIFFRKEKNVYQMSL